MKFYWVKTNSVIKKVFSKFVWDIPNNKKIVYLTFDDGPTPEITEWTLAQLKKQDIKATFFCIGNNIKKHPDIFTKILQDGHTIGNHTFNHLNGWKTETTAYIENIKLSEDEIRWKTGEWRQENGNNPYFSSKNKLAKQTEHYSRWLSGLDTEHCKLFRPPYGKIKPSQTKELAKLGYRIIMWDVLSADFDKKISSEQCLNNVIQNTASGSIIIFHDSVKAFGNLEYVLPKALSFLKEKGFVFEVIR